MDFKGFDKNIPVRLKRLRAIKNRLHTPEQIKRCMRRLSFEALHESPLNEAQRLAQGIRS